MKDKFIYIAQPVPELVDGEYLRTFFAADSVLRNLKKYFSDIATSRDLEGNVLGLSFSVDVDYQDKEGLIKSIGHTLDLMEQAVCDVPIRTQRVNCHVLSSQIASFEEIYGHEAREYMDRIIDIP